MPIPAYSVVLWELLPGGYSFPNPQSAPVPDGFVWVVREVTVIDMPTSGRGHGIARFVLQVGSFVVWSSPFNATTVGVPYYANNVRFVMEAGEFLELVTTQPQLSVRISGYQLSA